MKKPRQCELAGLFLGLSLHISAGVFSCRSPLSRRKVPVTAPRTPAEPVPSTPLDSSRARPLPQVLCRFRANAIPVGAGMPANTGKAGAIHRAGFFAGESDRRTAAPTVLCRFRAHAIPVGAALAAKRPAQATSQYRLGSISSSTPNRSRISAWIRRASACICTPLAWP